VNDEEILISEWKWLPPLGFEVELI